MKFLGGALQKSKILATIEKFIIKQIPVQPIDRNRLVQLFTWFIYALDYLTLILALIISIRKPEFSLTIQYFNIVAYVRIFLNIIYVLFQFKLIFVLRKLAGMAHLLIQLEVQQSQLAQSMMPLFVCLVLDIMSCAVRALSHEQRVIHFDSKFTLLFGFVKEIFGNSVLFCQLLLHVMISYQLVSYTFKSTMLIFWIYSISIFFCDWYEKYYDYKFKRFLLGMDIWIMLILLISNQIYEEYTQMKITQGMLFGKFFSMITIQLVIILLGIELLPIQYYYIFSNTRDSQKNQEWELSYRIELVQLLSTKGEQQKLKLFYHRHLNVCKQSYCFLKFHFAHKSEQNELTLNEALRILSAKEIENLSKKYQKIKYFYIMKEWEAPDKIYKMFRVDNFWHRREHYRVFNTFIRQQQNSDRIESDLAINACFYEEQLTKIQSILKNSLSFWENLLNDRVNCSQLVEYSSIYLKDSQQLQKLLRETKFLDRKLTLISQKMLHNLFYQKPQTLPQRKTIVRDYFSTHHEAFPAVLISAERQDFMKIVNANSWMIKATGYTKKQLCSLTIDNLWLGKFRQIHTQLVQTRSKQNIFHHNRVVKSPAFITNKFGYLLYGQGIVLWLNEIDGRKWVVIMKPWRESESLIVTTLEGEIVGVNQKVLKFGIDKSVIGGYIQDAIFKEALEEEVKIGAIINNKDFIKDKIVNLKYKRGEQISLKYLETLSLVGIPHFRTFGLVRSHNGSTFKVINQEASYITNPQDSRVLKTIRPIGNLLQFRFNIVDKTFYQFSQQTQEWTSQENICNVSSLQRVSEKNLAVKKNLEMNEDIQTMRYWNEELEYVENLQKLNLDAEPLPQKYKEDAYSLPIMSEESFADKRLYFEGEIKKYILKIRAVFIFCVVFVIILTALTLALIKEDGQSFSKDLATDKFIGEYFINFLKLSFYPLNQMIFPQTNWMQILQDQLQVIDRYFLQLNQLFPQIYSLPTQADYTLTSIEKQFQIMINDLIHDSDDLAFQNFYSLVIDKMYPTNQEFIRSYNEWEDSRWTSMYLKYVWINVAVVVLILISLISLRRIWINISENQYEIFKILSRLPDLQITQKVVAANRYMDFLNINSSIDAIDDEVECDPQITQDYAVPKALYKIPSQRKSLISILLSCLLIITLFSLTFLDFNRHVQNFLAHQKLIRARTLTEYNLYSSWINFMAFPNNTQLTVKMFESYHKHFEDFQTLMDQVMGAEQSSNEFKQFYLQFGLISINSNPSNLFPLYSLDDFFLNEATDGEKFLHAYTMINYETIITKQSEKDQRFSLKNKRFAAIMQIAFRMNTEIFVNQILAENNRDNISLTLYIVESISFLLICIIFLGISYRMEIKNVFQLQNLQKFLFSLPYKKLLQISHFRFYIFQKVKDEGIIKRTLK